MHAWCCLLDDTSAGDASCDTSLPDGNLRKYETFFILLIVFVFTRAKVANTFLLSTSSRQLFPPAIAYFFTFYSPLSTSPCALQTPRCKTTMSVLQTIKSSNLLKSDKLLSNLFGRYREKLYFCISKFNKTIKLNNKSVWKLKSF